MLGSRDRRALKNNTSEITVHRGCEGLQFYGSGQETMRLGGIVNTSAFKRSRSHGRRYACLWSRLSLRPVCVRDAERGKLFGN
jgi:hypothetical protein